jgi:long-chain acyl-CoA synthetase
MPTDKPWLGHYEPHVPEHIVYPTQTMPELLEETVRKYPQYPAIRFKGTTLTFAEMYEAINRAAASLQAIGVKKGDRVALHLPNCPQYPISYYAILKIGGIVVPCNPLYQGAEMTHQLNDSGAEIIITLSSLYPLIRQIRSKTRLRRIFIAEIKTYFPPFLKLLFTALLEKKKGHRVSLNGDQNVHWWTELVQYQAVEPLAGAD